MNEIWKNIEGFGGFYQVSNTQKIRTWHGKSNQYDIKRLKSPNPKKLGLSAYGYYVTNGYYMGKSSLLYLHIEIAKAFIPNKHNKPLVLHKDDDKLNNSINNLYWGTHQDNMVDRIRNLGDMKGENSANNKLTNTEVVNITILIKRGYSQRKIASMFNIDQSTVSDINRGKSWSHLKKQQHIKVEIQDA